MTSVVKKKQEIGTSKCSIFFFIKSDARSIGLYDARTKFFFLNKSLNLSGNTGIDTHRDNVL